MIVDGSAVSSYGVQGSIPGFLTWSKVTIDTIPPARAQTEATISKKEDLPSYGHTGVVLSVI